MVVVGLPRSGSSFLSHVLSQIEDTYVFDDLYLLEKADDLGIRERMSHAQLQQMLYWLGWQIRARKRFGLYAIPNVEEDEIEPMNAALSQAFSDRLPTVAELQEEWLQRLAHRSGAQGWGFKMPKAFRRLAELRAAYPGLKVIFLMRQPHEVLASYKHMPMTSQDGDPRRYHPLAYALYWRSAARCLLAERETHPSDTFFVDFAALVRSPSATARQIAAFLGTAPPDTVSVPKRQNSSHGRSGAKGGLTGLETWITSRVCGVEMAALGFRPKPASVRIRDLPDALRVTARFLTFRIVTEPLQKRRQRAHVARHATESASTGSAS